MYAPAEESTSPRLATEIAGIMSQMKQTAINTAEGGVLVDPECLQRLVQATCAMGSPVRRALFPPTPTGSPLRPEPAGANAAAPSVFQMDDDDTPEMSFDEIKTYFEGRTPQRKPLTRIRRKTKSVIKGFSRSPSASQRRLNPASDTGTMD